MLKTVLLVITGICGVALLAYALTSGSQVVSGTADGSVESPTMSWQMLAGMVGTLFSTLAASPLFASVKTYLASVIAKYTSKNGENDADAVEFVEASIAYAANKTDSTAQARFVNSALAEVRDIIVTKYPRRLGH